MKKNLVIIALLLCSFHSFFAFAEDGYDLWLRYKTIENKTLLNTYKQAVSNIIVEGNSPVINAAKEELQRGLEGLLGKKISFASTPAYTGNVIIGTASSPKLKGLNIRNKLIEAGEEGFIIIKTTVQNKPCIVITANSEKGVLYGCFSFLQLLQTNKNIQSLEIVSSPLMKLRILNHWDNLNRTVERGYAGFSLWKWHLLPSYIDPRYKDYARANASVGINGVVLTNVNASATVLTPMYLEKVAALANVFRPYGIKVYLTARFSAPIEIGGLTTADPLDENVKRWWKNKVSEIYKFIPDFGGFLVKANSEGQPGPQDYNRSHADGANMLADALAPHNGIVMWRAFVYSHEAPDDRFKQAYNEFEPLDGKFRENVMVQVKNGPIDFQPREPFHPLFGAMPKTPLMMEFQLTQEYLGFSTHLVYEAPLFKEVLNADTYAKGKGSYVSKVIDGSLNNHSLSGMAGVANIGDDRNWCGHPFAQANWFAFGRLAWNHHLTENEIADEWIRMTFSNNEKFISPVKQFMLQSRETLVNYMTPLGLHHIMGYNHHYGPAPWYNEAPRADWNPVYFHKADTIGIGFDRTAKGSNALAQYKPEVQSIFENIKTCPEEFLLWFHHVPWQYRLSSGNTFWNELCYKYNEGVTNVRKMEKTWNGLTAYVDKERFNHVKTYLHIQEQEAVWWKNACLLYFQTFSRLPVPNDIEKPDHTLEYYKALEFPFAP